MAVNIIIGAQWGDEGKGKVIDALSDSSDYVVRFNGGNNAGHTVINEYGKFPLHLIPSGIFSKKAIGCITNGVVLDLQVLVDEIKTLQKAHISLENKLYISPRCHLILPYHKLIEGIYEKAKGKEKTGTTGRGIGPVFADKVSYQGIRLIDLIDKKQFSEKLKVQLTVKNTILTAFGEKPLNQQEIEDTFFKLRKKILPYVKEPYPFLHKALKKDKAILMEGAQAVFLDNDWGTYPFVTASTIVAGGINAATGIPPTKINSVIGVCKAYTTRVGGGPFPTELFGKIEDLLRKNGHEFGATTGRPRRVGWFDAELLRFASQINGFTEVALTKLDVLDEFDEIKICTGYILDGKKVHYYDGDAYFLDKIEPVYKIVKGWKQSTRGITDYDKLPKLAKSYIQTIEKLSEVPITYISTGPKREELIIR